MEGFPRSPVTDLMVDIETFGSSHDTMLVSIGGVAFNEEEITSKFEVNIDFVSQDKMRTIDPKTLFWWFQKNHRAIPALHSPAPIPIKKAMTEFANWVAHTPHECIWANGASFDLPILRHALSQHRIPCPWKFWEELCMRPIRRIGQNLGIEWKDFITNESSDLNAHVGINDAIMQAEYVQAVMRKINERSEDD